MAKVHGALLDKTPLMTDEKIKAAESMAQNHAYHPDFKKYKRTNPYHEKLGEFDSFVLRDEEAETHKGKWSEVLGDTHPLNVEIGTGYGEFMVDYCQKNPGVNFVGLDHRFKRSFALARQLDKLANKNFRYLRARGERIGFTFGENEVQNLFYFFPDPWPKKRHNKNRLFQKPFLDDAHKILPAGGIIYVKTDHDGYFEWMLDVLKDETRFEVLLQCRDLRKEFPDHFLSQFTTKFEKIFLSQGTLIKALVLKNMK